MNLFRTLLVILALSFSAFAQTQVNVVSQGKSVTATASETLKLNNSPVITVIINGVQTTGNLGTLSFETPVIESGDFATGATFGSGGVFTVNAPGYLDYIGNFGSATWLELTYANGNHSYQLSGPLTSTEGSSAFICTTVIFKNRATFVKSAKIDSCSFVVTLN